MPLTSLANIRRLACLAIGALASLAATAQTPALLSPSMHQLSSVWKQNLSHRLNDLACNRSVEVLVRWTAGTGGGGHLPKTTAIATVLPLPPGTPPQPVMPSLPVASDASLAAQATAEVYRMLQKRSPAEVSAWVDQQVAASVSHADRYWCTRSLNSGRVTLVAATDSVLPVLATEARGLVSRLLQESRKPGLARPLDPGLPASVPCFCSIQYAFPGGIPSPQSSVPGGQSRLIEGAAQGLSTFLMVRTPLQEQTLETSTAGVTILSEVLCTDTTTQLPCSGNCGGRLRGSAKYAASMAVHNDNWGAFWNDQYTVGAVGDSVAVSYILPAGDIQRAYKSGYVKRNKKHNFDLQAFLDVATSLATAAAAASGQGGPAVLSTDSGSSATSITDALKAVNYKALSGIVKEEGAGGATATETALEDWLPIQSSVGIDDQRTYGARIVSTLESRVAVNNGKVSLSAGSAYGFATRAQFSYCQNANFDSDPKVAWSYAAAQAPVQPYSDLTPVGMPLETFRSSVQQFLLTSCPTTGAGIDLGIRHSTAQCR